MPGSLHIGKIAGIEISIHVSWLIIVVLLTWSLAIGWFPALYRGWSPIAYWGVSLLAILLLFVSVLLHELAHSLVARARGVPVKNITLLIFGGVSNIEQEVNSLGVEFQMAIVGPLTSLVIGASAMIASLGNTQARQLTELYRALRLYVNCFQPKVLLLSKQHDGKKVRCVYDSAKTPLQRLLLSSVLPGQQAAGTDRSGSGARPYLFVPTSRAVTAGRFPLCCELLSFRFTPPSCTSSRLFGGKLYSRKRSCRGERSRSGNRTPYLVSSAGAEKAVAGLVAHPQGPF